MAVVQVGLAPLLNIVTVCGMRMHAKHEQSKNHIKQAQMLRKVTHCAGRILAHTRPHQLHWGVCCMENRTTFSAWKNCFMHIYEKVVQHATKPNSHLYSGVRLFYCPLSFLVWTPDPSGHAWPEGSGVQTIATPPTAAYSMAGCVAIFSPHTLQYPVPRKPHPHCEGRGLRDHSLLPSTDIATTVCSSLVNVGLTKKKLTPALLVQRSAK